jgi:chromosomal replication initiation ATPase DnaA
MGSKKKQTRSSLQKARVLADLDAVVDLLDITGYYDKPADNSSPRLDLINTLERTMFALGHSTTTTIGSTSIESLTALEQALCQCTSLLESTRIDNNQRLTQLLHNEDARQASPNVRVQLASAQAAFVQHLWLESVSYVRLESALSTIYTDQYDSKTMASLIDAAIFHSSRSSLYQSASFQSLARLVKSKDSQSTVADVPAVKRDRLALAAKSPVQSSKPSHSLQFSTPAQLVQDFVSTSAHCLPLYSCALLVGPQGSGKTHFCNQVNALVNHSNTLGMYVPLSPSIQPL